MLTTEVSTVVHNHIQCGIYHRIEFYPNFDRPGGDQPADKLGYIFQDTKIFKVYCIENIIFGINYG